MGSVLYFTFLSKVRNGSGVALRLEDTHIWLWSLTTPERIAPDALDLISDSDNRLYLSAASSWEIAIKYRLGKVPLPEPPLQFIPPRLSRDGIISFSIEHQHCLAVSELPDHHNDPFDRLLIVQAQIEKLLLVTHDKKIFPYEIQIVKAKSRSAFIPAITGPVSGRTPRHTANASAACSTSIPRPSTLFKAPWCSPQLTKAVGLSA